MIALLPDWRPRWRRRAEVVEWLGALAERLTCTALRHPLTDSYGSSIAVCHCTARRVEVTPSRRRE